jgi:hypothetical protein
MSSKQQSDVPGNAYRLFYDVSDGVLIAFSDVNDAATSVERLKQFNSSWDVSYAYPAQGIEVRAESTLCRAVSEN